MNTEHVKVAKTVSNSEDTLEQKISQWKVQYGKLYKSVIDGDVYIWRKLKRKEYVELMADKSEEDQVTGKIYERQEKIASIVVLYPNNIGELIETNAGLATTIADEVIMRSGFELASTEEL
jgi:hypothetical protein